MSKNILFFCLDSCRYDTFEKANAPNMKAVGKLKVAHSPACWTVPSVTSYLMNEGPILGYKYRMFDDAPGLMWTPNWYQNKGYFTILDTWNACMQSAPHMKSGFNDFCMNALRHPREGYIEKMIVDLEALKTVKPLFVFLLIMETHTPYFWGTSGRGWETEPELNLQNQIRAVEYVDTFFPRILDIMRPATVYVTADHGDLHGPDAYSHSPSNGLVFREDLFKIPYIRGEVT